MSASLSVHAIVRRDDFELAVTMSVAAGEVVAVIGPNGAGKSTLLRAVSGLLPLSEGRIEIDGRVVDDPEAGVLVPPEQRRVGVVFQDYLLFPHLTVLENVAFGPRATGAGRRQARETAGRWIDTLGLAPFASRRPDQLSGGQSQRVALARALAGSPAVLLLDEPMAALDASTRIDVRAELRDHLRDVDTPTLLITHDPLDALMLADRILVLEGGHITQQGVAVEVARRPASTYVARLLGLNLLRGTAHEGTIELEGGGTLSAADRDATGPVLVALRPDAVSLHASEPHGSARNVWQGRVDGVEPIGDRVRVSTVGPPNVMADVTAAAVSELGLVPGTPVWLSTKATELEVYPAGATQAH